MRKTRLANPGEQPGRWAARAPRPSYLTGRASWSIALLLGSLVMGVAGCAQRQLSSRLQAIDSFGPSGPVASDATVLVRGLRNQTVWFALQVNHLPELPPRRGDCIRISPLVQAQSASIGPENLRAYQVLPLPFNVNSAGFVRQIGPEMTGSLLPRALLPLPTDGLTIPLSLLRNPDRGTDPRSRAGESGAPPAVIWVDLFIPPTVPPGQYEGQCRLVLRGQTRAVLPIRLIVEDLVMPDERHLQIVGTVEWEKLVRLHSDQFRGILPRLLNRSEPRYAGAVRLLDQLVQLAQSHRLQVVIPALQPTVKWPSGRPVQIDWTDLDSLLDPWLSGRAFPDSVGLGYWVLPRIDHLDRLDPASRMEYWQAAAEHFDRRDWLARSAIELEKPMLGRASLLEAMELARQARSLLAVHPRLRVLLPLEEEQIQLAEDGRASGLSRQETARVLYGVSPLVTASALQHLPEDLGTRFLRTDSAGLVPYTGAGADEREARMWAWLAFLRGAGMVFWSSVLPDRRNPQTPASPEEQAWFYPGNWFGVDGPVPTLQLKWLRQAQYDAEYLWLARQRGQTEWAAALARLLVRPVELSPAVAPDPVHGLLSGNADARLWEQAMDLLRRAIHLSQPGRVADPAAQQQLRYEIAGWMRASERPILLGRETAWALAGSEAASAVELRLGVDVYNAAEQQPQRSRLHFSRVPPAWRQDNPPADVPQLGQYSLNRFFIRTTIDLPRVDSTSRQPLKLAFAHGYTGLAYDLPLMIPVAISEQRQGPAPTIDGSLGDWSPADALHEGPLVRMLTRTSLQRQELHLAAKRSAVYSTWTAANLYLGFRVEGVDPAAASAQTSYVQYELRRAWAEDVAEVLIQPIYADNTSGPLLHLAMKPRGQIELSRRLDPRQHAAPWQAFAGAAVRYASTVSGPVWRGELMIPWDAMNDTARHGQRPALIRFNFSQHLASIGESASWAGPVDYGRDELFTGLLAIGVAGQTSAAVR